MNETKIMAGWFAGICTNTTCNTSANLLLYISGTTDSRLHGNLGLYGDLDGAGPFHASIKQDRVRFTTCLPAHQVVIEWSGVWTDDGLSGTYKVECDAPDQLQGDLQQQEGAWSCAFVRDLGAPDPDKINHVSVFHEGVREGPFPEDEFVELALAERWSPHALVATQDCTEWGTVGEFIAALQIQSIGGN